MMKVKFKPAGAFVCVAILVTLVCVFAFKTSIETDRTGDVQTACKKGIYFLQSIQRNDGAICDTLNPLFETWETILATTAIYKSNGDTNDPVVKKALAFLHNNENETGLTCHNKKCKYAYCLETTSVYFDLLLLIGENEKVRSRLKNIVGLQKKTGEWEIGNPDVTIQKDFASVTAFVLNLLHNTGAEPVYKKEGINWLLKKQTKQGDWGTAWEYYGCTGYALWPVMKLLRDENTNEARLAKDNAIAFILAAQNKDGSWFYNDAAFEKQTSAALQTALMLSALQNAGLKNNEAILKGINFLVNDQQKNGNWYGGYFPIPEKRYIKQEYVFATALAVDVMHNYLLNNNTK